MDLFSGLLHFQTVGSLPSVCFVRFLSDHPSVPCCSPVTLEDPDPKQNKFGELVQGKLLTRKEN